MSLARVVLQETILLCLLQDDDGVIPSMSNSHRADHLNPARSAVLDWLVQTARSRSPTETEEAEPTTSSAGGEENGGVGEDIEEWFWERTHCKLLAEVSLRHTDFFDEHIKFLVARTKAIERERVRRASERMIPGGEESDSLRNRRASLEEMEWEVGSRGVGVGGDSETGSATRRDSLTAEVRGGDGGLLSINEQTELVTAHWVELVSTGEGQIRDTCLALIARETSPCISAEEESGSLELSEAASDSVWSAVLRTVKEATENLVSSDDFV